MATNMQSLSPLCFVSHMFCVLLYAVQYIKKYIQPELLKGVLSYSNWQDQYYGEPFNSKLNKYINGII